MEEPIEKTESPENAKRLGKVDCTASGGSRYRKRMGRFFALLWLVFLVYPLSAILGSHLAPGWLIFSLSGLALFVGVHAWLVLRYEPPWREARASEVRKNWAGVAGLAALALVYDLAFGAGEFFGLFIYVSVAAGMTLPASGAYAVICCTTIFTAISGWTSGAGLLDLGPNVLLVGGLGVSTIWWSNLLARNIQLRRAREEIARLAVAEERLRFARDLHDLLGHSLSLIALKTDVVSRLLPDAPEKAAAEARDAETVARQALREVRAAVVGYRRPTLSTELAAAREVLGAAGIGYRVEGEEVQPSTAAREVLAWAVREGVTNVVRHSRARRCVLRLELDDAEASLDVIDDGVGVLPEEPGANGPGSGLAGLAERVAAAGGTLVTGAGPDGGFRLRVTLPTVSKRADNAGNNESDNGGVPSQNTAGDLHR